MNCELFKSDGYCVIDLSEYKSLFKQIRNDMDRLSPAIYDLWKQSSRILELAMLPKIIDIIKELYSNLEFNDPFPFQTLNYKNSPQQGTHSDESHFSSLPHGFMCGVWIAFETITLKNGPLFFVPKSHILPFVHLEDINKIPTTETKKFHKNLGYLTEHYEQLIKQHNLTKIPFTCKEGFGIIWASNLLHGSFKRQNLLTRYSQVTHYFFRGTQYYTPVYSSKDQLFVRTPHELIDHYNISKII